jgi:uncharacterized protein YecE (DUF72 family)
MAESAPLIHLGTSSWLYDGWKGSFYPEKTPARAYLAYYVTQFDTVEVNTSFYALPRPSTLVDWADTAPAGFTYALKAPRQITHEKKLQGAESEMLQFIDAVRALGAAAAPALLQLPPDFTRRAFGKVLAGFIDWLAPRLLDVRVAVEVRAADLMTPAFATFLAERGLALAIVERTHNPPVDLHALWLEALAQEHAPRFAFVRWIGDDVRYREVDNELVQPRAKEIESWAQRLEHLAKAGVELYGYMHNPYEGHAPASVRTLRSHLQQAGLPLFMPGDSGQMALF